MTRFWSKLVHDLVPYVPGEQPQTPFPVKLNTNELPVGPSPLVLEAIKNHASSALRLYPDPQSSALRKALADYHHLRENQVFLGNGSDEVLGHAFAAFFKGDRRILFPDITYSFYPSYCRLYAIPFGTVPLISGMRLRLDGFSGECGGIIFPNPNAPTGIAISRPDLARLLEQHSGIPVIVDEAYVDFGAETAIPLINDHPNLLVVRTMSKSRGLAGLRIGYAIGDSDLIEALTRVKDSFNSYPIDRLAEAGAIAALRDETYFESCRKQVIEGRNTLARELELLQFRVLPSSANFVFVCHDHIDGPTLVSRLREAGVLVRRFDAPRIGDYIRITVGTDREISFLVDALKQIINTPQR